MSSIRWVKGILSFIAVLGFSVLLAVLCFSEIDRPLNERIKMAVPPFQASQNEFPLTGSPSALPEVTPPLAAASNVLAGRPTAQKVETRNDSDCELKMRSLGVANERKRCIDIELVVKSLRVGRYVYNQPSIAYVGRPFRIVLVLNTTDNQIEATKAAFLKTEGQQSIVAAAFSQSIDATLRGADFTIDPVGAQRRTATRLAAVEWEWTVTPINVGKRSVSIEVMANIELGSGLSSVPYQIRTLRTEIEITATPFQQAREIVTAAGGITLGFGAVITSLVGLASTARPIRRRIMRIVRQRRRRKTLVADSNASSPD